MRHCTLHGRLLHIDVTRWTSSFPTPEISLSAFHELQPASEGAEKEVMKDIVRLMPDPAGGDDLLASGETACTLKHLKVPRSASLQRQ